jgi:lipid-A-disaccharide synthase
VHLVAPQLWAWGPWRIAKLRRRTDHVLCLLPFEEAWFTVRHVPATFVGHPLFDDPVDAGVLDAEARRRGLPEGPIRLLLLPGSRAKELKRNFPVMLGAFREWSAAHAGLVGVVAATNDQAASALEARAEELGGWPDNLLMVIGATDVGVRWCTTAVAVSGTVTLQVARQRRPMVILYKTNELAWKWLARHLITTRFISLPNLIAGREAVTELFPYFKGHERLRHAVEELITDADALDAQRSALDEICARFAGRTAATGAADAIERLAGMRAGAPCSAASGLIGEAPAAPGEG